MNVCVCPTRRNGSRRCRETIVQDDGMLVCGAACMLATMMLAAVDETADGEMTIDVAAFVRDAVAKGWRIVPPRAARRRP